MDGRTYTFYRADCVSEVSGCADRMGCVGSSSSNNTAISQVDCHIGDAAVDAVMKGAVATTLTPPYHFVRLVYNASTSNYALSCWYGAASWAVVFSLDTLRNESLNSIACTLAKI